MKKKPKIMKVPGKKACVNPYLIHSSIIFILDIRNSG